MIQRVYVWAEAFVPHKQLNTESIRLKGTDITKLYWNPAPVQT